MKIKIQYLKSGVIQNKIFIDLEKTNLVKKNKAELIAIMQDKNIHEKNKWAMAQDFEDKNLCKFQFDEIAVGSPMYNALTMSQPGDICEMLLPEIQGGIHKILILELN